MKWQIGDVTITQFIELDTLGGTAFLLPQATPDAVRGIEWLRPQFADEKGRLRMTINAFLVETSSRRIIVDTGLGNDKQNRIHPAWNGRNGSFLRDLAAAGCPAGTIDTVLCTHLHVDHVGWNTIFSNGRWIPAFPNARHLLGRIEFDHWKDVREPSAAAVFDDSVRPVADAGLIDLIDSGHDVCSELSVISTPGHSPGHLSIHVRSRGEEALFIGDVAHHPCQFAHVDWCSTVDSEPRQAARTRHDLFSRFADTPARILGGHFTGGTIVRDGDAFRLAM
jgi:glyoxylase-like metal-dependent hydrolase (beta-lactamase superfamily II)